MLRRTASSFGPLSASVACLRPKMPPQKRVAREKEQEWVAEQEYQLKNKDAADKAFSPFESPAAEQFQPRARTRQEHKTRVNHKLGSELAEQVKTMSDTEWESIPLASKQQYTQFIKQRLREAPAEVTEQQQRRYYETTLKDPRDENPAATVKDTFQRVKLGLPVEVKSQRELGVSQAMYDAADASLFNPDNVDQLEDKMTQVKQQFVDYIQKRRQGLSTEAERRHLSTLSADLNYSTQQHLANMFKFAELRIAEAMAEEYRTHLAEITKMKRAAARARSAKSVDEVDDGTTPVDRKLTKKQKKRNTQKWRQLQVKRVLRDTFGLDVETVQTLCDEVKAQEEFLQMCEVMTRMTLGKGFEHTAADESLEEYLATMKNLYTTEPGSLGKLDAVRYAAALESVPPLEWAQRWFKRALLVPVEHTPEYQRLKKIKDEEEMLEEALAASRGTEEGAAEDQDAPKDTSVVAPKDGATRRIDRVENIVDKMFLSPGDPRMKGIHEERLKHLAFIHIESQLSRMRENAKVFDGVENTSEAEQCRALYAQLNELKAQVPEGTDPFADSNVQAVFAQIQGIVRQYIHEHGKLAEADVRLKKAKRFVKKAAGAGGYQAVMTEVENLQKEKRRTQVQRMLRLLEKDVREDMVWLENLQEAERPPLIPIPEELAYVSVSDVNDWAETREQREADAGNPFKSKHGGSSKKDGGPKSLQSSFNPTFLGQAWKVPDKPMLFWGTGAKAVQQALRHAAEDAERRRTGKPLAPEHPCPENPYGWRLRDDVLDSSSC